MGKYVTEYSSRTLEAYESTLWNGNDLDENHWHKFKCQSTEFCNYKYRQTYNFSVIYRLV